MTWIIEHWQDILAIYGCLFAVSKIIVIWTKTYKDDKILNKIIEFFDLFSTAFKDSDKKILEKALEKNAKK